MITEAATGTEQLSITLTVNGTQHHAIVPVRRLLSDFLRHDLGLTGTHVGCEHGVCGACTILVDGRPHRSCLLLAVQADGLDLTTIEGLRDPQGELSPLMQAFVAEHGLQCGFCTPGFVVLATNLLSENPQPTREQIVAGISGNLCRCTGYQGIVRAIERAAQDAQP